MSSLSRGVLLLAWVLVSVLGPGEAQPEPRSTPATSTPSIRYARGRELLVRPEDLQWAARPRMLLQAPALVVALLDALAELKQVQPQWAETLAHQCYGGLTLEETARMRAVDEWTVRRWWGQARPVLAHRSLQLMHVWLPGGGDR